MPKFIIIMLQLYESMLLHVLRGNFQKKHLNLIKICCLPHFSFSDGTVQKLRSNTLQHPKQAHYAVIFYVGIESVSSLAGLQKSKQRRNLWLFQQLKVVVDQKYQQKHLTDKPKIMLQLKRKQRGKWSLEVLGQKEYSLQKEYNHLGFLLVCLRWRELWLLLSERCCLIRHGPVNY